MASGKGSGIPYSARISNILSLSIESKALLKSTKTKTASLLQLLIGLSALAVEAYGFTLVRSSVRDGISRKPRIRFWWFFAQSYILMSLKKCSKRIFEKNSRLPPRGVFDPKTPLFGWKMAFWAYIFKTAHQILMIFSQMLDIIALNDSASVLCARKFLFAPGGGAFCPPKC